MKTVRLVTILAVVALALALGGPAGSANASGPSTYSTGIQIQNLSNALANVTLSFYAEGSATATAVNRTVPASGQLTLATLPDAVAAGFSGAAVISSDQQVAALVNVVGDNQNFGGASYIGFSAGAKTANIPIVFRGAAGFDSFFNVQNVSGATATVNVTFTGGGVTKNEGPFTIPAGSVKRFNQATDTNLPSPFNGSAIVTSDQDIVATVMEVNAGTMLAYNGFAAGSAVPAFPLINMNNGGIISGIAMQNLGTVDTNVTVSYLPSLAGAPCTETKAVPAKGTTYFALTAFVATEAGENCANGATFVGSARVTVNSATQPLVGIVNQLNNAARKAGSYDGFDTSAATGTVVFPVIMDRLAAPYNYFTGVNVMNVGDVATNVNCVFTNGTTTVPQSTTSALQPNQTFSLIQGGAIASGFVGTGTCTANAAGAKIVGMANEISTAAPPAATSADRLFVYEGINN